MMLFRAHWAAKLAAVVALVSALVPCLGAMTQALNGLLPAPAPIPPIVESGRFSDLEIAGAGYFVLQDFSGRIYYTRFGAFLIDAEGYLVNWSAWRVQGLEEDLKTRGPIRIAWDPIEDWAGSTATIAGAAIMADGAVVIHLSDGRLVVKGQVLLQNLNSPEKAEKFPGSLLLASEAAGPIGEPAAPGNGVLGVIRPGRIEVPHPQIKLHGKVGRIADSCEPLLAPGWNDTDLAIQGRGFFIVRDVATGIRYATRAGTFYWDADGYLLNYAGMRVQGTPDDGGDTDVRVTLANQIIPPAEGAMIAGRSIGGWGDITVYVTDGSRFSAGTIVLRDCRDMKSLTRKPYGLYEIREQPGLWKNYGKPGEDGLGSIDAGVLDLSQIDDAIVAKRRQMNFFRRGIFLNTGKPLDLYIDGEEGFFMVRDADRNALYATRNGAFHLDADGWVLDGNGFRVQGFAETGVAGDLKINAAAINVRYDGSVVVLENGSDRQIGQFSLQRFGDPQALKREDHFLYSNVANARPLFAGGMTPGSGGTGTLISGALEDIALDPGIELPSVDAEHLTVENLVSDADVEASTDLTHWMKIGIASALTATADVFDSAAGDGDRRFYRVVVPGFLPATD